MDAGAKAKVCELVLETKSRGPTKKNQMTEYLIRGLKKQETIKPIALY